MGKPQPLLILSDAVSASSGLARITRELATRVHDHLPEFRVGTVGYGGPGSRKLPFAQYHAEVRDWMPLDLPQIWEDFCGDEQGILMSIWDLARLGWLGQPENPEFGKHPLCRWVREVKFKKWIYAPIDACGPHGKLSFPLKQTLLGFDRVLLYSQWSKEIVERSGVANTEAIPHGIDTDVFYPRDHVEARFHFGNKVLGSPMRIKSDEFLIGVVATNQPRKDWNLVFETAAILRDVYERKVRLWLHTDALERHWSLPTLAQDYQFGDAVVTLSDLTDEQMAWAYSACDVTLGIGRGEGFGYPLAESLACGTPVLHHRYGGAVDWMPSDFLISADGFFNEGLYSDIRPISDPDTWARKCVSVRREDAKLPPCLEWKTLWKEFENWLRRGLQ